MKILRCLRWTGVFAVASFLASSTACASVSPTPLQSVGQDFSLAVGKSVSIQDTDLVVRFDRVLNDSRCPSDVQCVSAGDATVQVALTLGSTTASRYELHTDGTREVVSGQYRVTLVDLKPVPTSTRPVKADEYVMVLRISRP